MQTQYRVLVSFFLGIGLLMIVLGTTKPSADISAVVLMLVFVFAAGATTGWQITSKS